MTSRAGPPLATAGAAFLDQYTVRRDVTYLIRNGIEPNDAVQRVVAHRRRLVLWGLFVAAAAPWSGGLIGYGAHIGINAMQGEAFYLFPLAPVLASIGLLMVYVALMYYRRSWRLAARGVACEDGLSPFSPSRRRAPSGDLEPEPYDGLRWLLASAVCLFLFCLWAAPILGGTLSALVA